MSSPSISTITTMETTKEDQSSLQSQWTTMEAKEDQSSLQPQWTTMETTKEDQSSLQSQWTTMEKTKEDQSSLQPQCLIVSKNSLKSRSSNCLMDPAIGHWLPGINLTSNNEWTNLGESSSRPFREDGGSSQSNSHFEHWKVASDKQRLKRGSSSRRKKRKKVKNLGNVEDGGKEDDQLSPLGRKIIVFVAVSLFLLCILLVGVTLRLGPVIDEMALNNKSELTMEASNRLSNQDLTRVLQIPNVVLPPDIEPLNDSTSPSSTKITRNGKTHSSFPIPKGPPPKRSHLCRHHSDSETKDKEDLPKRRPRPRRVRRSVSAIETNKSNFRPRVRRSFSDRSGLIMAGKHLLPPARSSRPHSICDTHSSRCSSIRTMSSNVSLSEIVAVELGLKDIPGLTPKEARRRRVVLTVMLVFTILLVLSVVLVAVTLLLSPAVDEVLRKGNEEIYRSMSAGASTSSPTTEGSVVANNTAASSSGTPG